MDCTRCGHEWDRCECEHCALTYVEPVQLELWEEADWLQLPVGIQISKA